MKSVGWIGRGGTSAGCDIPGSATDKIQYSGSDMMAFHFSLSDQFPNSVLAIIVKYGVLISK